MSRRIEGVIEMDPEKRYILIVPQEDEDEWRQELLTNRKWDNIVLCQPGEVMTAIGEVMASGDISDWEDDEDGGAEDGPNGGPNANLVNGILVKGEDLTSLNEALDGLRGRAGRRWRDKNMMGGHQN